MKRFYVAAAIAASLLATGCQKTYVIDEVRTPIGFITEVGKQTKTIIDGTTFTGEFGVISYGIQGESALGQWNTLNNEQISNMTPVMDNVKISKQSTDSKWAASGSYFWPNDAKTSLSFFAYYPYQETNEGTPDAENKTLGKIPGVDVNGITLKDYVHDNIYVDFMTADAINKTYATAVDASSNKGVVGLQFSHHMTQICFDVTSGSYTGVTIALKKITIKANSKASFNNHNFGTPTDIIEYTVFDKPAGEELSGTKLSTILPCTVLPQTFANDVQAISVEYTINGNNVANETVKKIIDLSEINNHTSWTAGQRVTYKMVISLNEITFNPTVADWTEYDSNTNTENVKDPVDIKI